MASWTHSPSRLARLAAVALGAAALAAAAPVRADSDARALARMHFRSGVQAWDLGLFEKALESYTRAYQLEPRAELLFNIGQCYRKLARWERAGFFYRRFLELAPAGHPDAALVRELLTEVDVRHEEEQRREREQAEAERERELELARAEEAARREGRLAAEKSMAELAARAAEVERTRSVPIEQPPAAPAARPVWARWWFWAAAGTVAAGVVTAVAVSGSDERQATLGTVDAR